MYPLLKKPLEPWQDKFKDLYPNKGTNNLKVRTVTVVLTEDCNLRCSYCYILGKNAKNKITKETAKDVVDFLASEMTINDDFPGLILEFIGGEPLLEVDIMDYIVSNFKIKAFEKGHPWANNYMINLTTNGLLYSGKKFQDFLKKNTGRVSVTITIDGNKSLHDSCRVFPDGSGSYDKVVKNIGMWTSQYIHPSTKVTFAPENIPYISEAIPHLFDLGIVEIHANPVFENVWKESDSIVYYRQLLKLADIMIDKGYYINHVLSLFDANNIGGALSENDTKNWCGSTGYMLAIGTEGKLYPCVRFMDYSLKNRAGKSIGNIWDGICEDNLFWNELKCITRQSQSEPECLQCPVSKGCSWCTGFNYDCFGTPNKRATFICKLHKARVLANKYYWDKLSIKTGIEIEVECNLSSEDINFFKGAC
jgi:uncharacterized protein